MLKTAKALVIMVLSLRMCTGSGQIIAGRLLRNVPVKPKR
jgi:hypothetical protein